VAGKQKLQPKKYSWTQSVAFHAQTQHMKHANAIEGLRACLTEKILTAYDIASESNGIFI